MMNLGPLTIDLILCGLTFGVLSVDLALPHGRKRALGYLTAVLLAGLFVVSFFIDVSGSALSGAYQGDAWVLFFKRFALVAGVFVSLGAVDYVDRHFPTRQGEFWVLMLFTLLGMTLLPGARDLLLLIVCFELMGLPLVVLASFAKSEDKTGPGQFAPEAGLKLYLVSSVSTAITLYGVSIIYGLSGTTKLAELGGVGVSPMLFVGLAFALAGMGFKIGAVPFHMWVPDTYQGTSTPFVSFLSVAPKATGFAALAAVLILGFAHQKAAWAPLVLFVLVTSIFFGNLFALAQKDLKRLLAYSGIAQVGYMMIGLLTADAYGMGMLLFYIAGYLVTNMGAFLVLHAVAPNRSTITLDDVRGLSRRSPRLALALLLFLLSLAGIPFVVGFWAKLYVFMAAYRAGYTWLVLYGALMAIVALFYYLQIAKAAYMEEPTDAEPIRVDGSLDAVVMACMALVVVMGLYPSPFLQGAMAAARALFG